MKPPVWFWIVAVLAVLWYSSGAFAYLAEVGALGEEARPPARYATPAWVIAAFAISVWIGLLGTLSLLARSRWAGTLLIVSLIAGIANWGWVFLSSGEGVQPLGVAILVIGAVLVWFSRHAAARGWLR